MDRPTWDEYFINIALLTSKRSNCIKRKVGCVIVNDNRVVSLGYNGTPTGIKNCFEGGCERCNDKSNTCGLNLDLCICLHAEENALLFADYNKLVNSTLYVNVIPCIELLKQGSIIIDQIMI
jgi:dCMP deaminase